MALWNEQRCAWDVKAVAITHVRVLPSEEIPTVCANSPDLSLYLGARLAKRLRRSFNRLARWLRLSQASAATRVAFLLHHLGRQQGEESGQRKTLTLPLRRDMAQVIGLTRYAVSRALTEFEIRGFIKRLGPKRIAVLDSEALYKCSVGAGAWGHSPDYSLRRARANPR